MDGETARLVDGISPASRNALEISGSDWGQKCSFKKYRSVSFAQYDVCAAPLSERFDLVIAEQIWEHLERPLVAAQNVYDMLAEGGYFLVTTPFLIKVHEAPIDCSRWTEAGLRNLLISAGFLEAGIITGSWGNRACLRANFKRWMPYRPLLHSLDNEPEYPLVVWALAKK
jgi:SAM-dependent methyltransferase